MLSERKAWMDGELVAFNDANVHIMSHSFCRGSAVFEVMSLHETALGPAVFRLDDHVQRLVRSAQAIRMELPSPPGRIKEAVNETVRANQVQSGFVKLIIFYGGVEFEVVPRRPAASMAVVAVDPLQDLDAERFKKAARSYARVTVSGWRKFDPRSIPVECKSAASYLGGMIAKLEAMEAGFTSCVLLDLKGYLAEGPTESLFIVRDRVLLTPSLGNVLSGITRKTVLELAKDIGIKTREKKIRPADLMDADEAFLTSSVIKIWPVQEVDGQEINAPGEVSRLLDKSLERICAGEVAAYKKWLTPVE